MSYITAIGIAVPENRFSQSTICKFMEATMSCDPSVARKVRAVFRASGIDYRYSVLSDYGRTSDFEFYPNSADECFPDTKRRMNVFRDTALPLSVASVNNMLKHANGFDLATITHLIVVSCTGMYAPGLDIDLVKALKLSNSVQRTCIQFMGCYAAFNALKAADAFCFSANDAKVLIVCTELCSIHFQNTPTEDNILANALFGDGSCALLVESQSNAARKLRMLEFHNDLAFDGEKHMAWEISNTGFEMNLSSYIPQLIKDEIRPLVDRLLGKYEKQKDEVKHFALHPGGKKILEMIEDQLGITKDKCLAAYSVLKNFGNLSSATVVFVLYELFQELRQYDNSDLILAMSFGPGLTLESMLLKMECV